jgi:hypothetical protein
MFMSFLKSVVKEVLSSSFALYYKFKPLVLIKLFFILVLSSVAVPELQGAGSF